MSVGGVSRRAIGHLQLSQVDCVLRSWQHLDVQWSNFLPYLGAAFLYVVVTVAPSLKTFTDHLVLARPKKKDKDAETSMTRADEAATALLEDLATLREAIPTYATLKNAPLERDEMQPRIEATQVHDQALATLEANIMLLTPDVRAAMTRVLNILRAAHDLSSADSWREEYHPDSTWSITRNTVRFGREILAAHLRREPSPAEPDVIHEYLLAVEDRESELRGEFAQEISEDDEAIRAFRVKHDLSPERRPWPE